MGFVEEKHAESALTDAASDGVGELAVEEHAVECERCFFGTTAQFKLVAQRLGAHAYAHRGDFKGDVEHMVPEEDVAVEGPVVVVRGASVVAVPAFESLADLHEEYRLMGAQEGGLPLAGGEVRIQVLQLLGGDEGHLPVDEGQDGELGVH